MFLVGDKITNFQIFTQPIPIFYSKYKTETAKTGQRQLLEKKILHDILKIRNFVTYQITFFMSCQQHKYQKMLLIIHNWTLPLLLTVRFFATLPIGLTLKLAQNVILEIDYGSRLIGICRLMQKEFLKSCE